MNTLVRPALSLLAALTLVTGLAYPLAVTGIAQTAFPDQAAGSLVRLGDRPVGSRLLGQPFSEARYFWSRPSATSPMPYNAANSSGANQGPLNPALMEAVKGRIAALKAADPGNTQAIPVDLVTTSASGLDPHISIAAARYQASRIAKARGMKEAEVNALLAQHAARPLTKNRHFQRQQTPLPPRNLSR